MSTEATAIIVADSISPEGIRLTTFQLRYWRPIHSELMTHRVFSRNAGSSRARPSAKIIEQVYCDPWGPIHWGMNEPGMQANKQLEGAALDSAKTTWMLAAQCAAKDAQILLNKNVHKQVVNRLLEPFTYIDMLVTATDYANFFALRDHPDAQPEIQDLAKKMRAAYHTSIPKELRPGEWHLPYISEDDWILAYDYCKDDRITRDEPPYREKLEVVRKISVARCARVSYKAFDGNVAPIEKDLELFEQLLVSQPLHASPAEHQATPDSMITVESEQHLDAEGTTQHLGVSEQFANPHFHGNFRGWCQFRRMLPGGITDEKTLLDMRKRA